MQLEKKEKKLKAMTFAQKEQIVLNVLFTLVCILFIIPFVLVVSISLSNEQDIVMEGYRLLPKNFDLSAYKYVFKNPQRILNAYKVTIIFSVGHVFLHTFFCCVAAYPLSKREFFIRKQFTFYLFFTMLFSGGLVPSYILITQYLHLKNTIWVYILPGIISPWNVFMVRTFFQNIPEEMQEAARIDGADEYQIFFRFIIPLSKPVIATISLLTFLGSWNNWATSLYYIDNPDLYSLQYLLQEIMKNIELLTQSTDLVTSNLLRNEEIPSETVRMAMAVVVAGPALVIFPFFQKYFAKGLTVGSVKG